jgi:hypothetical protein
LFMTNKPRLIFALENPIMEGAAEIQSK